MKSILVKKLIAVGAESAHGARKHWRRIGVEKVKVTREQADAIDFAINGPSDLLYHNNPDELLSGCAKDWEFGGQLEALNSMSIVTIAKALYIGYEVEEFEVGDWVVVSAELNRDFKQTKKITKIKESYAAGHNVCYELSGKGVYFNNEIRYATPEEIVLEKIRRSWKEVGREINDYRVGDIVTTGAGGITREVVGLISNGELRLEQGPTLYRPDEVFLVCPVEKRADVIASERDQS
jgi:hypothetical protein